MCGIAGLMHYRTAAPTAPDESIGLRMIDSLQHRGPDDGGLLVAPGLLLGHRRLSILDLSDAGHQPMSDERRQCWIVFNGEIYNFRELRSELERGGRRFVSESDTEVLLHGYLEWGENLVQRLNGMFAFALWDQRHDSLWLVRDPIGIKPLFYCDDSQTVWFGSEIQAILAGGVAAKPDWQGLDLFLTYGYTPAPHTGFAGVRQLLPGESLRIRRGQDVHREGWYRFPYPERPTDWSAAESLDRLEMSIDAAVKRQMVSDVPLGALLSGGVDSTAVVRAMRRIGVRDIDTFTIAFDEASFDESPYAAQAAELFQTRHHTRSVAADVASLLPVIVSHAQEPLADNSAIPFYLLSQAVRERVTVALSGDGADELLAGYATYSASALAPLYRRIPQFLRANLISPLVHGLPVSQQKYSRSMLLRRFVDGAEHPFPKDHCSWRRIVSHALRGQLYTERFHRTVDADPLDAYAGALDDAPDWLSPLEQQLHLDLRFHLPNDMLVKADRMSMAHSLEVRVPLLDLEVVRTCLSIPPSWKRYGRVGKYVLKQLLSKDVPATLVQRKKAGFLAPVEKWLRHEWQPLLRSVLTPQFAAETDALEWTTLARMLDEQAAGRADHAYPLFALLVLGLWWRMWITQDMARATPKVNAAPTKIHRETPAGSRPQQMV